MFHYLCVYTIFYLSIHPWMIASMFYPWVASMFSLLWIVILHGCLAVSSRQCFQLFGVYVRFGASLVAQMVKNLPPMWEIRVQSLGQENLLEKEMATHSSILAWEIPWAEKPGGLQFIWWQRVGHNWVTNTTLSINGIARSYGNF